VEKTYDSKKYEDKIYEKWEKSGLFNPDNLKLDENAKNYSVVMPPPNVTGVLHMGHAAMLAYEDILIRYHRMKGNRTLWLPGTDHAAIATQTKVEKDLKKKNETRHSLGREKFLEKVDEFAKNSHDTIEKQIKKMGSSCDWSREAYTLDETRHKAVYSVFKMMHEDGLIYQGERIVNWCPRCHSTLADDEVEHKEENTRLYWIKYGPFILATTRPETKLGDTAVAVHPDDKRYKKMIGKKYKIPGVLGEFEITVVADKSVDPEFGSGAIKVTPAHSFVDNEIARKNNLPMKKIIDEEGKMMKNCGKYAGMTTKEARKAIVADMEKMGLIDHIDENYAHSIAICYRCETIIEPLPSKQWFIDVNKKIPKHKKSIKELSIEAVEKGVFGKEKINIYPERFEKIYFNWMKNLRDWCISRQIWFGHQIPVWYKKKPISLTLIRHAQTDWNKQGIMQGQTDVPLNEKGKKQAKELRELIKKEKIDLIIISPLARTRQTTEIINYKNLEIIEDDRLKERSYGKFEGKKTEDLLKNHPEITTFEVGGCPYWIDVPTAETYDELRARVEDFIKGMKSKYAGKNILIVSHGDTLDMFYAAINNVPNEQAYGKFSLNGTLQKYQIEAEEIHVDIEKPKGNNWQQDSDTLDTWFSSGLWTFSTLANSPDQISIENGQLKIDSSDFKNFHPTSVMETGYDIIFFWVARMIIMTTYAISDIPFKDVYLHGLVLDDKGKKMSKSKGNALDPLEMCDQFGTDATRLSLIIGTSPGSDMKISPKKIEGERNFVNKLWNIARYILENYKIAGNANLRSLQPTLIDSWILEKMRNLIDQVEEDLERYKFSQACEKLRAFTWNDFADWYIEASKFEDNKKAKAKILNMILADLLKLWHPFMPFVTEKIWGDMNKKDLLLIEKWPKIDKYSEIVVDDVNSLNFDNRIKEIIRVIRNVRTEYNIKPKERIEVTVYSEKYAKLIESQENLIKNLRTGIKELDIKKSGEKISKAFYVSFSGIEIYIPLEGIVDVEKERKRLKEELEQAEKYSTGINKKLSNKKFIQNAPTEIKEKEKEKLDFQKNKIEKIKKYLKNLG
jgi:valyl-tRNA synthetase